MSVHEWLDIARWISEFRLSRLRDDARDERHPFVNVAEPSWGWSDETDLMIGDMGSLYLFLGADGTIQAVSQSY